MNATVFHFQETWADLKRRLPEKLKCITAADLEPDCNTNECYIKLRVVQKWPMVKEKEVPVLLKILAIQDGAADAKKVPIFFLGKLSEACQTVRVKDILVLSNFRVERNRQPSEEKHSCQINLDVFQNTYIWISTEPSDPRPLNHKRGRSERGQNEPVPGTSRDVGNTPAGSNTTNIRDDSSSDTNAHRKEPARPTNITKPVTSPKRGATAAAAITGQTRNIVDNVVSSSGLQGQVPSSRIGLPTAATSNATGTGGVTGTGNATGAAGGVAGTTGGAAGTGGATGAGGATCGAIVARRENLTLQPGKGARDYVYTTLKHVRPNTLVNVYGVVKFFKPAAKTRGTDYYMVMSITDPSLEEEGSTCTKLKCILFSRDLESLPQISNVGDIIRLHRLSISTYQGQPQGQKGPGFSAVVFDGTKGGSLTPTSSTKTYTLNDDDLAQVEKLRDWSEDSDLLLDTQVNVTNYDTFADMQPGKYYNIICQVTAISEVNTDVHFLFKCWDGTSCQHSVYEVDVEALNSEAFLREDKDLMSASTGYRLDVSVYDDHCESAANVSVGDFVKFVNLHAMIHKDPNTGSAHGTVPMLEICLHRGTHYGRKMVVMPGDDPAVQQLKAKLESLTQERLKVQAEFAEKRRQLQQKVQRDSLENSSGVLRNDSSTNVALTEQATTAENAGGVQSVAGALSNEPVPSTSTAVDPQPSTSGFRARKRSIHEISSAREAEKLEEQRLESLRSQRQTRSSPRNLAQHAQQNVRQSPRRNQTRTPQKTPQTKTPQTKTPLTRQSKDSEEVISPSPTPKAKRSRMSMLRGPLRSGNRSQVEEPVPRTPDVPQCMQKTATVISHHHHIDPVTIDHILAKSMEKASKFRLKAHVVNYEPKAAIVQDLLHLHCEKCKFFSMLPVSGGATDKESMTDWQKNAQPAKTVDGIPYFGCPNCPRFSPRKKFNKADMLQYTIAVKLLLEDETGSLVAQILKENAHTFFDRIDIEELWKKKKLFKRVMKELDSLTSSEDSSNQADVRPIIDCCIASYDTSVGVCFQIFDTVLTADLH